MEEKKINELADEEIDTVAGGVKRRGDVVRSSTELFKCKACLRELTNADLVDGSRCPYCGQQAV